MSGSADTSQAPRHFIAINHHRFHDRTLVEKAVTSAVVAARRLRNYRPDEGVCVTLFHAPDGLSAPMRRTLEALDDLRIEPAVSTASNGGGLNAQMEHAAELGATFFYRTDADDPVHVERFLRQAQLMDDTGADVSGGGLVYTNLETGHRMTLLPAATPDARDYLYNCAMLHPTLAFRLPSLQAAGIRYWGLRLEDKHLGLQIARAGLKLVNDPVVYGDYSLNPQARTSTAAARLNLSLNWQYLRLKRRYDLVPLAMALFFSSALLPAQWMRRLRNRFRPSAATPYSGSAGGNGTGKTAPPPPGSAQTDTRR